MSLLNRVLAGKVNDAPHSSATNEPTANNNNNTTMRIGDNVQLHNKKCKLNANKIKVKFVNGNTFALI